MANTNSHQIAPVTVVAVPFPAQSHLNQLLQLSCLLSSSYSLPIHFVGSSIHNRQAKHRCSNPNLLTKIHFQDLPIPPFPSPPPTRGGVDTDFPAHLQPSIESSLNLRQPFATFLQTLTSEAKKVVVIHDALMSFVVQDAASLSNVELYCYHTTSSFRTFARLLETKQDIHVPKELSFPFHKLPSMEGCFTKEVANLISLQTEFYDRRSRDLYNTCRVIEGDYLDLLEDKRRWAIGPVSLMLNTGDEKKPDEEDKCIQWLNKQPPNSVLYVSFGTTSSMVQSQIQELATGLEESKIRFIWVFRDADRGDIFIEEEEEEEKGLPTLPYGFEERMEGVGMVVRGWVPQGEILGHPSTGGFMSHCGWGSCLESISAGVPIAAWPMHSDQPVNATFVTEVLKIGVVVREWSRREELVTVTVIKESVRKLMASEEGEIMRKKAKELGRDVHQATKEGGVSRKEIDSFIDHISI